MQKVLKWLIEVTYNQEVKIKKNISTEEIEFRLEFLQIVYKLF